MTRWLLRIVGLGIIGSYLIVPTFFKPRVSNHSLEHVLMHTLNDIQSSDTPFTDEQWLKIGEAIEYDEKMKSMGYDNDKILRDMINILVVVHILLGLSLVISSFLPFTKQTGRTKQ